MNLSTRLHIKWQTFRRWWDVRRGLLLPVSMGSVELISFGVGGVEQLVGDNIPADLFLPQRQPWTPFRIDVSGVRAGDVISLGLLNYNDFTVSVSAAVLVRSKAHPAEVVSFGCAQVPPKGSHTFESRVRRDCFIDRLVLSYPDVIRKGDA